MRSGLSPFYRIERGGNCLSLKVRGQRRVTLKRSGVTKAAFGLLALKKKKKKSSCEHIQQWNQNIKMDLKSKLIISPLT